MSRNYLIVAQLLIALYLMFFRARASGYAPRGQRTESEAAMDRLLGRA